MTTTAKKKPTVDDLVNKVLDLMVEGRLDKHLNDIAQEIAERRRVMRDQLARKNARELKIGTKVRIVRIRPKYMVGYTGTVVDRPLWFTTPRKPGIIYVDMGRTFGRERARYGPVVGLPADSLEAVHTKES